MYIHLIELVLVLIMTNKKELVPPFTHFTADTVLYLEHSESSGEYEKNLNILNLYYFVTFSQCHGLQKTSIIHIYLCEKKCSWPGIGLTFFLTRPRAWPCSIVPYFT